ncbi:MAG: SDR family oxidoreductase [Proteobacteria bacterium]|nr:SDR family oxidoreductase [Pseudomonadota bacterium]
MREKMGEKRIGVLIGGSGLLGGTIVNFYKTRYLDSIEVRAPSSKKVSIRVKSDICDYLADVKPDFVINASMAKLGAGSQLAFEVNYLGVVNLARAANALGVPFIHISSSATMPPGLNLREDETLPLSPHLNPYAKSKLMAELTLKRMAEEEGLDYTCIRLAIVYGAHDHKIQGFHRMFLSIADKSMPFLFTQKNTLHSYSNSRKLPFLINHMLENRDEFSGSTYNFVDQEPIDLTTLILTIKSHLHLTLPKEIHIPSLLSKIAFKQNTLSVISGVRFLRQ